jgi:hypothetical protein
MTIKHALGAGVAFLALFGTTGFEQAVGPMKIRQERQHRHRILN